MYLPRSPSLASGKLLVNMSLFLKIHVATGNRYYIGFHWGSLALSQVSGYDLRYGQNKFAPAQSLGKVNISCSESCGAGFHLPMADTL